MNARLTTALIAAKTMPGTRPQITWRNGAAGVG
jgi:hypothetical protein